MSMFTSGSAARAAYSIRPPAFSELGRLEAIWSASQDADNAVFRPRHGWWSLNDWALAIRLLHLDQPIGVAAINRASDVATAEGRIALLPAYRQPDAARIIIATVEELAAALRLTTIRLYLPSAASWATHPASRRGFKPSRAISVMLRPSIAGTLPTHSLDGVLVRRLHVGEEGALLAALNRAWAGTWNFRPLTVDAIAADLHGTKTGFFVAIDLGDERTIVGTVHAMFDPAHSNPDGKPYAWISNLTTDPNWRGRGLGRLLLAQGINALIANGAGSIALGVDSGDVKPVALYRSVGFETIDALEVWERNGGASQPPAVPQAGDGP